jgi:dTDP-glucose 4,6-dehydratase
MSKYSNRVLVTGGAGFIGSHFIDILLNAGVEVLNIDCLTYAANLQFLDSLSSEPNHQFMKLDIRDSEAISNAIYQFEPHHIVNFAAESHVDNSINNPQKTIDVNFNGAKTLYHCANLYFKSLRGANRNTFIQISTDEVYGSRLPDEPANEASPLNASNIYSASKASADLLGLAYYKTYNFPLIITRCCNNYGPRQNSEKLIPTIIKQIKNSQSVPVYGSGKQIRQWIHVKDHARAIYNVLEHGESGNIYNIGDQNYITNISLVKKIAAMAHGSETDETLDACISYVSDRLGHDFSYSITSEFIREKLDWSPRILFEEGLRELVLGRT